MCILFVYALLKVVSYYDFSVLSMSVMGFQKKFGLVARSIQVYFGCLEFFNFAKPLRQHASNAQSNTERTLHLYISA